MKEIRWKKRFFWSKGRAERFVQKTVASARCSGNYEVYCLDGMRLVNWAGLLWHEYEILDTWYGSIDDAPACYEILNGVRRQYLISKDPRDVYARKQVVLKGKTYPEYPWQE